MATFKIRDKETGEVFTIREKENTQVQQQQPAEQPMQQGMEKQNILGQIFNVPGAAIRSAIQGKGYTQGAMNPSQVPTFQNMALENYYNKTPSFPGKTALGNVVSAGGMVADMATNPTDLLATILGGVGAGTKVGKAIGNVEVTLKNDKLAGNIIKSLIKPAHKDMLFGKNPGLGVSKEGIVASNLDSLGIKVTERIDQLKEAVKTIRSTPENLYKSVDLSSIRKPLVSSIDKLKRTPLTNASEISGVQDAMVDITNFVQKIDKVGLNKLPISDAYEIKDVVSKMQKWDRPGTGELNKTLKQVYHEIDSAIDKTIPELKELNSRIANLISAQGSIKNRIEVLSKQEGMPSLMRLIDLPFAALKTPTAKTTLGRLLAKQYRLPK
jgi:hypothetical protein